MTIHAHTLVASLVEQYPYAEEVFSWHGVKLEDTYRSMSLYALCWVRGIELQQLIDDIEAVVSAEEDPTEELSPDEWTDEVKKANQLAGSDETWDWGEDYAAERVDLSWGGLAR